MPATQLSGPGWFDSARNSCENWRCDGRPSADAAGNGMKPGPIGGANEAPKPPSMSPRLYVSTCS
jgi:hypothetical protein